MCAKTDGFRAIEQLLKGGKTYRPIVLNNNNNNKGKKEKITHRNFENHSTTT